VLLTVRVFEEEYIDRFLTKQHSINDSRKSHIVNRTVGIQQKSTKTDFVIYGAF